MNTLYGVFVLCLMLAFVGMWVWAWSDKRKVDFQKAANLPLNDETE